VLADANDVEGLGRLLEREGLSAEEAEVDQYALLGQIDFRHPLFAPMADPRFNDFTKIHFWRYRRLDVASPDDESLRVLARFDNGDPALLEQAVGRGRLMTLTSSWRPIDSELARSSKFVLLMATLLEYSEGGQPARSYYAVNEPIRLPPDSQAQTRRTLRRPDGAQVTLASRDAVFANTELPGRYELSTPAKKILYAVNVAASESKTTPMDADQLEQLGVQLGLSQSVEASPTERRRLRDIELEKRQKIWRWLLAATLIVLIGETWLGGLFARSNAPAETES
jgi:hypothetical protein